MELLDIITNNFSIDYSIYMHDFSNKGIVQFSYYEKDYIDDQIIYLEYFGKLSDFALTKRSKRKSAIKSIFEFSINNFCNFVNKLEEFYNYKENKYPRTIYMPDGNQVLRLLKINKDCYELSCASTFYLGIDNKFNWVINFNNNQAHELLNQLQEMKSKILVTAVPVNFESKIKIPEKDGYNLQELSSIVGIGKYTEDL